MTNSELIEQVRQAQAKAAEFAQKWYVRKEADGKLGCTPDRPQPEQLEAEVYPGGRVVHWGCR